MRRCLLISDLDGTLLGDDAALERFARWHALRAEWLTIAYSSGRLCSSIEESLRSTKLPTPLALVGGVGTEIWHYPSRQPWSDWAEHLSAGWNADRIDAVANGFRDLECQPVELCTAFKRSFFAREWPNERVRELRAALAAESLQAEVVYSSRRDLDILPSGANKGAAARFLAERLGFAPDEVFVSGDSGNDLAMFQCGFRGIVVGNAHPELLALAGERIYCSALPMADGVRDGLAHWLGDEQ